MAKITVQNTEITVLSHDDKDYISLTDMANGKPQGERLVKLNQIAIQQMQVLEDNSSRKLLK